MISLLRGRIAAREATLGQRLSSFGARRLRRVSWCRWHRSNSELSEAAIPSDLPPVFGPTFPTPGFPIERPSQTYLPPSPSARNLVAQREQPGGGGGRAHLARRRLLAGLGALQSLPPDTPANRRVRGAARPGPVRQPPSRRERRQLSAVGRGMRRPPPKAPPPTPKARGAAPARGGGGRFGPRGKDRPFRPLPLPRGKVLRSLSFSSRCACGCVSGSPGISPGQPAGVGPGGGRSRQVAPPLRALVPASLLVE